MILTAGGLAFEDTDFHLTRVWRGGRQCVFQGLTQAPEF